MMPPDATATPSADRYDSGVGGLIGRATPKGQHELRASYLECTPDGALWLAGGFAEEHGMTGSDERAFIDRTGVKWTVTEMAAPAGARPERERRRFERASQRPRPPGSVLSTRDHGQPWLRFESHGDSRRLQVVPADWRQLSAEELEDLLGATERVAGF
jgi:hypothetical protein